MDAPIGALTGTVLAGAALAGALLSGAALSGPGAFGGGGANRSTGGAPYTGLMTSGRGTLFGDASLAGAASVSGAALKGADGGGAGSGGPPYTGAGGGVEQAARAVAKPAATTAKRGRDSVGLSVQKGQTRSASKRGRRHRSH